MLSRSDRLIISESGRVIWSRGKAVTPAGAGTSAAVGGPELGLAGTGGGVAVAVAVAVAGVQHVGDDSRFVRFNTASGVYSFEARRG